ncbi:Glucosamine--fructose-6-phosphate aminotransferase isomerizing 2 [Vespula maculifrons]|uniref:Glucosamine--fructose-6-phosphate aminotransferase isomerizing 2 n=1 Tax=Vespula maculifrons TaxID=7453 RepID=A0ABD2CPQ9_VESMC
MTNLIIGLVATFCIVQISTVQAESMEVLKARHNKAKGDVGIVINDLMRSKRNLDFDLNMKLFNNKINSMQAINNMTNPAMKEIRAKSGRLALRNISLNSFAALNVCLNNAKQGIVPAQNNMDAIIAIARKLLIALDNIFLNCYSNIIYQMQNCIAISLGNANSVIRNLQITADNVKNSGNVASINSNIKGNACFSDVVSSTRLKVFVALNSTKSCINSA